MLLALSGVIAVDPAASRIVCGYADIPEEAAQLVGRTGEFSTDAKEGPMLAQSWYVLDRIRQTVEWFQANQSWWRRVSSTESPPQLARSFSATLLAGCGAFSARRPSSRAPRTTRSMSRIP